MDADPGFAAEDVLTFQYALPGEGVEPHLPRLLRSESVRRIHIERLSSRNPTCDQRNDHKNQAHLNIGSCVSRLHAE